MKINKPETVLYRAPTSSLLASHGGLVHRALLEIERKEEKTGKEKTINGNQQKKTIQPPQSLMDLVKFSPNRSFSIFQLPQLFNEQVTSLQVSLGPHCTYHVTVYTFLVA